MAEEEIRGLGDYEEISKMAADAVSEGRLMAHGFVAGLEKQLNTEKGEQE